MWSTTGVSQLSSSSSSRIVAGTAVTATCLAIVAALYVSSSAPRLRGPSLKASNLTKPRRFTLVRIGAYFQWGPDKNSAAPPASTSNAEAQSAVKISAGTTTSMCSEPDVVDIDKSSPESPRLLNQPGIFGGQDLLDATNECIARVAQISEDCRADNRRFRDIEFDLASDKELCLYDLTKTQTYYPMDARRVSELYEKPRFFVDKPDPNDIVQGAVGDCWFLSALSAISTVDGLVERICVDRDEEIGVYAFIFRRNGKWVPVIIDDLLYTSVPKYETLGGWGKILYNDDRNAFNSTARKGGDNLYFARSGKEGETWVPLIEKAYAKLYGSYEALHAGFTGHALEELTGGVSECWMTRDILDRERWWEEELVKAGQDRFFDLSFPTYSTKRSGASTSPDVEGLYCSHAYNVLRAKEVGGRKFVVLRNPWGSPVSKWKGKWGDGSKQWSPETSSILQELGHTLGDNGIFIMKYDELLEIFEDVQRTLLLTPEWSMISAWAPVPPKPDGYPCAHGEIAYSFELTKVSKVHLVLSQPESRAFTSISGRVSFTLDFMVRKLDDREFLVESPASWDQARSVACEMELEPGQYAVYPRIQRKHRGTRRMGYYKASLETWDKRKLARVLSQRAETLIDITGGNPPFEYHWKHISQHYLGEDVEIVGEPDADDSSAKGSSGKKPPPIPPCSMTELPNSLEDRESLVLGLQIYYAQPGALQYLTWQVPPEGMKVFPVKEFVSS